MFIQEPFRNTVLNKGFRLHAYFSIGSPVSLLTFVGAISRHPVATESDLTWLRNSLGKRFLIKDRGISGPDKHDKKGINTLYSPSYLMAFGPQIF